MWLRTSSGQAEHDVLAASVLVTDSVALAEATEAELAAQLQTTVHREQVAEALNGPQSGIVLVDDLEAGVRVVNAYAAEHLEIQTADAAGSRPGSAPPGRFSSVRGHR